MSADVSISIENLIKAIDILHNNVNTKLHKIASSYLIKVKRSSHILFLCDRLLYMDTNLQTTFFASSLLKEKVQQHFEEVPLESRVDFKNSMIVHAERLTDSTDLEIHNQICLIIVNLFIQMADWEHSLEEIITKFHGASEDSEATLLKILMYIPEEINNERIKIGLNRRTELLSQLFKNRLLVLEVLDNLSKSSNQRLVTIVFKCFQSFILNIRLFLDIDLSQSGIISTIFLILRRPSCINDHLYKSCCDCVSSLLEEGEYEDIMNSMLILHSECLYLQESFNICVKNSFHKKMLLLANVFSSNVNFTFSFITDMDVIRDNNNIDVNRSLDMLHEAAKVNEDCAVVTFQALFSLIDVANESDSVEIISQFQSQLTAILLTMTGFFIFTEYGNFETRSALRNDVSKVIKKLPTLFHCSEILEKAFLKFEAAENGDDLEAAMFIISCVIRNINTNDPYISSMLLQIVTEALIPNLDTSSIQIKISSVILFGKIEEWLQKNISIRDKVFRILISMITDDDPLTKLEEVLFYKSIKTVSTLCDSSDNTYNLSHFQDLYHISERLTVLNKSSSIFYRAIGTIVINSTEYHSPEVLLDFLRSIFNMVKLQIIQNTKKDSEEENAGMENLKSLLESIKGSLDMFVDIENSKYLIHLISGFSENLWPFITSFLDRRSNDKLFEDSIQMIKSSIKMFSKIIPAIITFVCEKINSIYANTTDNRLINLAIYITKIFYKTENAEKIYYLEINKMASTLANLTVGRINDSTIKEDEELINEFYKLLYVLSENKMSFFVTDSSIIDSILDLSLKVLKIGSHFQRLNTIAFLYKILSLTVEEDSRFLFPLVGRWLNNSNWNELLTNLLVIVSTDTDIFHDSKTIESIGGIIVHARLFFVKQTFKDLIQKVLEDFPNQRKFTTNCQLNELFVDFLKKSNLVETIKNFRSLYH